MNIVEYIKKNYGGSELRKLLRFHKMNIPERYWKNPSSEIIEQSKKCYEMIIAEDIYVFGVITNDEKMTNVLVSEIIKRFSEKRIVKLIWFDTFLSDFYDKWNGVFSSDKMNGLYGKSAIGILGVTHKRTELKDQILFSFTRFVKSMTHSSFKTRIILGLDTMNKSDVPTMYGDEFDSMIDKKVLKRIGD